ncbi:MAG: DNA primase [Prevotellaceae bacterium]|nr:DNA primase [Prevotellaceae bacterium]
MIDQATVSRIMEAANIADIVGEFVTLRKRGVNYVACCPFHDEKTPSFSVSPSKGIFKCFGCGKAGNAASFLMEHERLSYVDALKYIAKKYGIPVEEKELTPEQIRLNNDRESMMVVSAYASKFFIDALHHSEEGKAIGMSYFKERGFTKTVVEKFQLGYSPAKRSSFSDAAIAAGYKSEFLERTGLSIKRDDGALFDRFAGRVIFPVISLSGRVIAFGGRTLQTDKKTAKYINSPESDIYQKRNNLYGLFLAKQAISKTDKCYLVEGYTDVISMYQAGIENVVASSGTSLTEEQIKLIKRFTQNVTVLFDGDAAGIKASLRGIDMLLSQGMNIKVALLPDGEDPDSFARKNNAEQFHSFLDTAEQDFLSFKIKLLLGEAKNDPLKKAEVVHEVVRSIAVIPDRITRSIYAAECSKALEVEEGVLLAEIANIRKEKLTAEKVETNRERELSEPPEASPVIPSFVSNIFCNDQEKELLMYVLKHGREELFKDVDQEGTEQIIHVDEYIIQDLVNDKLELQNLQYRRIFEEYYREMSKYNPQENSAESPELILLKYFINHEDPAVASTAANLLTDPLMQGSGIYEISKIWNAHAEVEINMAKAVLKAIATYKLKIVGMARHKLSERIKEEVNESEELLKNFSELNEQYKLLAAYLERVVC